MTKLFKRDRFYNIHYKPARYWRRVSNYQHSFRAENLLIAEKLYKNLLNKYLDKKHRMVGSKKTCWDDAIKTCLMWIEYINKKLTYMDGRYDK